MRRFDLAMVGTGGVSLMHYLGYEAHPERVRVVAACDPEEARLEDARKEHGVEKTFTSLDDLIANGGWDVAVVCTPTPVREEVVCKLAAAGKHIFVEKPFADNLSEAQRMVAACEKAGVKIAVNQNFRYHYPFHIAKKLIEDGRLGKVYSITHVEQGLRQDAGWRIGCGRHVLAIMGIHWFDGFRWILDCDVESMSALMCSSPAIDCAGETEAFINLRFENGVIVSYNELFSSPAGHIETLIVGEKGTLVLSYGDAALYGRDDPRTPIEEFDNPYAGHGKTESAYAALNELLIAVENDSEAPNSGQDNLKTVALLEGAYLAAERDAIIRFKGGMPQ